MTAPFQNQDSAVVKAKYMVIVAQAGAMYGSSLNVRCCSTFPCHSCNGQKHGGGNRASITTSSMPPRSCSYSYCAHTLRLVHSHVEEARAVQSRSHAEAATTTPSGLVLVCCHAQRHLLLQHYPRLYPWRLKTMALLSLRRITMAAQEGMQTRRRGRHSEVRCISGRRGPLHPEVSAPARPQVMYVVTPGRLACHPPSTAHR